MRGRGDQRRGLMAEIADSAARPLAAPKLGRDRLPLAWIGIVPFLALRPALSDPSDRRSGHRRVPHPGRRLHAQQHRAAQPADDPCRLLDQHRGEPRLLAARRARRLPACLGGGDGAPAALHPPHGHDLLRRRFELRRHSARLRLPGDARADRARDRLPDGYRRQPQGSRLHHPELLGPHHHLSLLPDSADGADPHAGARRHEEGMARGGRHPGRQPAAVPGAMSRCRFCGRACSAPPSCSSPTPSAPSPPPMR